MPSYAIHLAIANELVDKFNFKKDEFIFGNILPDVFNGHMIASFSKVNHSVSHYSNATVFDDGSVTKLPEPEKFVRLHDVHNDLRLGYYVHLLTDFFYNNYAIEKYGEDTNKKKQHDFKAFEKKIFSEKEIYVPVYDDSVIDLCKTLLPLNSEQYLEVINFFKDYKKYVVARQDLDLQLFSLVELENLYSDCVNFIIKNINRIKGVE